MEKYTHITWIDGEKDDEGRFLRELYHTNPDKQQKPTHFIISIEMIDDDGIRIDYENLEYRMEEYIELLTDILGF